MVAATMWGTFARSALRGIGVEPPPAREDLRTFTLVREHRAHLPQLYRGAIFIMLSLPVGALAALSFILIRYARFHPPSW
jgi:hypothetical protein